MTVARNAAAIRKVTVTGAYSANTLAAQFTAADFPAAGDAAMVSFSGTPNAFYLVVNTDGTAGYSNADFVIRVNYTGTLANFAIA